MKNTSLKNKQAGLTLVELGIVVAVSATFIVLGLLIVPKVLANNRANAEMAEVTQIITNIQKTYANANSYQGATLDAIARLNAFPAERVTIGAPSTAVNRWGGAVTITVGTLTSANDIIRMVYAAVPEIECKAVIQGMAHVTRRVYVDNANGAVAGGGTLVKGDGALLNIGTLGGATGCGANLNSITYDIGR